MHAWKTGQSRIRASVIVALGTITGFTLSAAGLLGPVRPALAQESTTRAAPPIESTTRAQRPPRTVFTFDGTPVHIWAPTQAPYAGSAYDTIGGQPGRSGDSLMTPGALEEGR